MQGLGSIPTGGNILSLPMLCVFVKISNVASDGGDQWKWALQMTFSVRFHL